MKKNNFIQMRDLTDEEWMKLPKKEILQLYKNCYKMLLEYISHDIRDTSKQKNNSMPDEYKLFF